MESMMQNQAVWAEEFLGRVDLFEKCSPQDIHLLTLNMRKQSFDKGDTILFQGIISHQLYFVVSGMVAVFSRKDKVTRFIANLEKGAFFGEISLVKNCAATATIKAAVDQTEIYTIEHDVIREIMERHPEVKSDLEEKVRERNAGRLEAFEKQKEELPSAAPLSAQASAARY
ncbi:MAG TPA: cyclic nucleotide-binding domain-containing protein [Elusimicrobiota bacterium]|nr:cyclic nucleotide-binding domain-containing protein [Elusimicrobiota bacterium]